MNPKTLILLEYPKILAKLKSFAGFSASQDLAEALRPTSSLEKARALQQQTREARALLSVNDEINFTGSVDLRQMVSRATRGVTLEAAELIEIRNTLVISRDARRILLERRQEAPSLSAQAELLSEGKGLIDLINKTISERGEVLDSASDRLGHIRSEMKVTQTRLMERMTRFINEPHSSHMLQENLITQRAGRYVLPLKAEFKGQIPAIIHDQSASGATLFIEPLAVVEWNNKYRELELAERDEVLRILHDLSGRIAEQAENLKQMVETMAALDLALMKARYAAELDATEPILVPFLPHPPSHHPGSVIHLRRVRHPLLNQQNVVPIDVELDSQTFVLVLTGPNTGGKTVTLKTVGLAVLMAQSGLQIPAQSGSTLSIFRDVFADIGDEQSIEQSLSTFSGHITQLVQILRKADYRSLVLLDELGAGTDPQEGSALARAVLTHLISRKITCFVATHYPELKAFAHVTPGATNASLEFDLATLRPTYHLIIGLPGRSNALAIAERLGLKQEIIELARSEINPTDLHADDLLDEIRRQRDLAKESYDRAEQFRREAESDRNKVNALLEQMESEKAQISQRAQQEADDQLQALQAQLDEIRREISHLKEPEGRQERLVQAEEALAAAEAQQEKKTRVKRRTPRPTGLGGPLKVGERVQVRRLGAEGIILTVGTEYIEVQVGSLRMRLRPFEVERKLPLEGQTPAELLPSPPAAGKTAMPAINSPGLELDLRGQRVEEALDALQTYLERGFSSGMLYGRIIHGKGTGALRLAIREALRQSPYVQRWESGGEKEGGDGVSVVFFAGN